MPFEKTYKKMLLYGEKTAMFSCWVTLMNRAEAYLACCPGAETPMGRLVCNGLRHIACHAGEFDREIHPDPFLQKHFLETLTSLCACAGESSGEQCRVYVEDAWLSLFEDLALFVRERALRCCAQCPVETNMLQFFESSGEWQPDAPTLVGWMYWYGLPWKIKNKSLERR